MRLAAQSPFKIPQACAPLHDDKHAEPSEGSGANPMFKGHWSLFLLIAGSALALVVKAALPV
jgi:hypothetical protein